MYWVVGLLAFAGVLLYGVSAYQNTENISPNDMNTASAEIIPIFHATAVLRLGDTVVYTDPTGGAAAFQGQPSADIVLVTDIHGDHLNADTLAAVVGTSTLIVPQAVKDQLPEALASRAMVLANGEESTVGDVRVRAVPMYNVPESADAFHTKGRGNGYVLERGGARVYVAGDTGPTPEMKALEGIDAALIPMNLPYTMSVEDAAAATLAFRPAKVYPYHYRGQDGLSDVSRFKQLVEAGSSDIEVVLLDWYPAE